MTPLIDVVFILLVFFMLVSNFTQWRTIPLHSASLGESSAQASHKLAIQISPRQLIVDKKVVSVERLSYLIEKLDSPNATLHVVLIPDHGVTMQRMVTVLDELAAHGIDSVTLAQ
jgi:biopolymer transport protein ExbD